jgi:hypothetical protein
VIPNCCLVISVVYDDKEFNLNIYPGTLDNPEADSYYFLVEDLVIGLSYSNGIWTMYGESEEEVFYTFESNDCPVSDISQWIPFLPNKPPFTDFTIYDTGCGGPTEDVVVEIEINNTVYNPCKYKNALIKGKRGLSQDVANLKGAEVFQLDSCKSDWSSAIAKYLAIDALKCPPYNMYTESDERCLISQLATNYKC